MTGVASCPKSVWTRSAETLKFLTSGGYEEIRDVWQLYKKRNDWPNECGGGQRCKRTVILFFIWTNRASNSAPDGPAAPPPVRGSRSS